MGSFEIFVLILMILLGSGHSQFKDASCGIFDLLFRFYGGRTDPRLNFLLYTRSNPQIACELQPTQEALAECNFNPNVKTEVIIHGFLYKFDQKSPEFTLKDKILEVADYNVVAFNWTYYTDTEKYSNDTIFDYKIAVSRLPYVSFALSSWMHFLHVNTGAKLEDFHLIANSLGTELASYASKSLCTLGHITYIEPASYIFEDLPEFLQPSAGDALFTDVIHTNGGHISFYRPLGDIDYYLNGGSKQPSCYYGAKYIDGSGDIITVNDTTIDGCNHDMAFQYYLESVGKSCKFLGLICDSYKDFKSGKCSRENAPVCRMGFYSRKLPNFPIHTKCYVDTSASPPYCLN